MQSDLQTIPGIGKQIEKRLLNLGYSSVSSLKGQNPEEIFQRDCCLAGCDLDPCLLYVYRLAVYFAENEIHEEEKLKWWNWKNVSEKKEGVSE